ncbi:hypothetical protein JX265_006238 [Neoarthrinium moseri]|uniref:Zn(2)-C6 fungal-type domain-containing protein n=1 Tax=Neoarthrinium moseri TaxID=1658444 RepID=A0A9Q0AP77_9PEZI|nr:hypothetical protein JX265_006238 [Neoarthrinium moseri]
MAIAAPLPSQAQALFTPWGATIKTSSDPRKSLGLMTDIMSYQYPPPPHHHGAEMDLHHPGYLSSYPASASSSMEGTNEADHGQFGPAGDKKRNKLGYHRTSVACVWLNRKDEGHCRRRKIRCMPQPNDVQGRCANCIRLKKDCSFYSVGQEPAPVPGQKPGARPPAGTKIASASSSPAVATGHPPDVSSHQSYAHLATIPSIQNMGPPSLKPETYPADPKMSSSASSGRTFDYGHGVANWIPADTSPSSVKAPGDAGASWRTYPHESPITPAFSPYTPQHHSSGWPAAPPIGTPGGGDVASSRPEDVAWAPYPGAPPARSLSYGGEASQSYTPASQIGEPPGRSYDRRASAASAMYPTPITTSIPHVASVPGTTMDPHVSLSAGAIPPSSYGTWQQPYAYSKSGDGYDAWYGNTGHNESSGGNHPHSGYYGSR